MEKENKKGREGKQKIDFRKDPEGRIDGGIARTAKSFLLISVFNFRIKISRLSKCPSLSVPDII